ncbi:MAG TPA: Hpt domain-containing protein [Spirochaetota bacterium]|nr:Hpt domain-containing protein [Spirochaetota bacterium]
MSDLNLNVFNYKELLNRFMDEKDVVNEVIAIFVEKIDRQFVIIEDGIKVDDLEKIKFEAHNIKGGALNLCAKEFGLAAKNLEDACKNKDNSNLNCLFANLKDSFKRLKKELIDNNYYIE